MRNFIQIAGFIFAATTSLYASPSRAQQVSIPFDASFSIQFFGWPKDANTDMPVSFFVVYKVANIDGRRFVCGAFRGFPATAAIRRFVQRGEFQTASGLVLRKGLQNFEPLRVAIDGTKMHDLVSERRIKATVAEINRAYSYESAKGQDVNCHAVRRAAANSLDISTAHVVLSKKLLNYVALP